MDMRIPENNLIQLEYLINVLILTLDIKKAIKKIVMENPATKNVKLNMLNIEFPVEALYAMRTMR
jgi:hypothetical protein